MVGVTTLNYKIKLHDVHFLFDNRNQDCITQHSEHTFNRNGNKHKLLQICIKNDHETYKIMFQINIDMKLFFSFYKLISQNRD